MKYTSLVKTHANSRYQAGVMPLAMAETGLLLARGGVQAQMKCERRFSLDWIDFECDALSEKAQAELSRSAHLQLVCEVQGEAVRPIFGAQEPYMGEDLPYVLKYKGKTNEVFTRFLINMALCASEFEAEDKKICLLDPMCGRGTTLFEAINRGWNAMGTDVQAADVDEAGKFFKRYLEYHRIKHTTGKKSMTAKGKEAAVIQSFEFARDTASFKAGDTRTLRLTVTDSSRLHALGIKGSMHLIAADLPYGVQHAPGGQRGKTLEQMVKDVLPAWRDALVPGGAMALAFNVNTLKLDFVRDAMAKAGLKVMSGEGYDGLEHWVEQAISRDVAVAVKA